MELLASNAQETPTKVIENGRVYFRVPIALIVPGVLNGSKGGLYYPPNEVKKNPGMWNDVPITFLHPTNPVTGQPQSAKESGVLDRVGIGFLRNDRWSNDKRVADGYIDAEKLKAVDKTVYNAIVAGQKLEVSTGLFTRNLPALHNSHHNGRQYHSIATDYRADHLAILGPYQVGACSIADGCGLNVNSSSITLSTIDEILANADSDGRWITTSTGAKVFIKDGQDIKDAIAERFPSKHNPEITYGNKDDRDSDDKHFDKEIKKANRDVVKAKAALASKLAEGENKQKHISDLREALSEADKKVEDAKAAHKASTDRIAELKKHMAESKNRLKTITGNTIDEMLANLARDANGQFSSEDEEDDDNEDIIQSILDKHSKGKKDKPDKKLEAAKYGSAEALSRIEAIHNAHLIDAILANTSDFFSTCERDDGGHCLPSGDRGSSVEGGGSTGAKSIAELRSYAHGKSTLAASKSLDAVSKSPHEKSNKLSDLARRASRLASIGGQGTTGKTPEHHEKAAKAHDKAAKAHVEATLSGNITDEGRKIHAEAAEAHRQASKAHSEVSRVTTNELVTNGQIRDAAEKLSKHPGAMPGYGQVFINDETTEDDLEVWYVGGDGDTKEFGQAVKDTLAKAGAKKIIYEAESFPPRDHSWVMIYPEKKAWSTVVNANPEGCNQMTDNEFIASLNNNPEGCNQHTGPGCGSGGQNKEHSVGDEITYTGKIGSHPAEFRGYHTSQETGQKVARIIVRPKGEPPFETSVDPKELSSIEKVEEKTETPKQEDKQATQVTVVLKPPKSLPDTGQVEYRGFKLAQFEGTQVGHKTQGGGLKKQLGFDTSRKVTGVMLTEPNGYERHFDTLKKAVKWIEDNSSETTNQGRHLESGQFLNKTGAGVKQTTSAAKSGFADLDGEQHTDELEDETSEIDEIIEDSHSPDSVFNLLGVSMKLTPEQKQMGVTYLVTNCDCWKGKDAVLNGLDDDMIINLLRDVRNRSEDQIIANSVRTGVRVGNDTIKYDPDTKTLTKNACGSGDPEEPMPEDEEDRTPTGMMAGKKKASPQPVPTGNTMSPQQFDQLCINHFGHPAATVKAGLDVAMQAEQAKRQALVKRLVSNVQSDERKKELAINLLKKPIPELESMIELLPPTQRINNRLNEQPNLNFLGVGGGPAHIHVDNAADDILETPTINWAEMDGVSPTLLKKLKN